MKHTKSGCINIFIVCSFFFFFLISRRTKSARRCCSRPAWGPWNVSINLKMVAVHINWHLMTRSWKIYPGFRSSSGGHFHKRTKPHVNTTRRIIKYTAGNGKPPSMFDTHTIYDCASVVLFSRYTYTWLFFLFFSSFQMNDKRIKKPTGVSSYTPLPIMSQSCENRRRRTHVVYNACAGYSWKTKPIAVETIQNRDYYRYTSLGVRFNDTKRDCNSFLTHFCYVCVDV